MSCRAIHAKEDGVSLGNDHTTGMTVTTATNNIVTFLLVVLNFKISVEVYITCICRFFSQISRLFSIHEAKKTMDSSSILLLILVV